jgi:hypothetical protein
MNYSPELNTSPNDDQEKSLKKINAILFEGLPVSVTGLDFTGDIAVGQVQIDQTTPNANEVVVKTSALPAGAATQTTVASILAKIIAAPATEAKQDSTNTKLDAVVAKIIAAPATEAKQDTGNSTLSTINGKITACNTGAVTVAASALPSGASTEATLAALSAKVTAVNTGAVVVSSGSVTNTPAAGSIANSTAYAASLVVKASVGRLFSLSGYNSGPAQFIHIYNATSLPAETSVPVFIAGVPAQSTFSFDFAGCGLPLSTGIVVSNSSTGPTKTIGSSNCFFTAVFI